MIDWYSPIQIGSCTTIGPRHPTGFTPSSLYSLIVSCVTFCESLPYFCRISWIFGCSWDIARLALICFRVSGYIAILTTMVNAMMLSPKLLARIPYRNISAFSMGPRRIASQMSMIMPMPVLSLFYCAGENPASPWPVFASIANISYLLVTMYAVFPRCPTGASICPPPSPSSRVLNGESHAGAPVCGSSPYTRPSLDPTTSTLSDRVVDCAPDPVLLTSAGVPRMPSVAMNGSAQSSDPDAASTA